MPALQPSKVPPPFHRVPQLPPWGRKLALVEEAGTLVEEQRPTPSAYALDELEEAEAEAESKRQRSVSKDLDGDSQMEVELGHQSLYADLPWALPTTSRD